MTVALFLEATVPRDASVGRWKTKADRLFYTMICLFGKYDHALDTKLRLSQIMV